MGRRLRVLGVRVQDLKGSGQGQGMGFSVPGLAFRIWGLGFSSGFRVPRDSNVP